MIIQEVTVPAAPRAALLRLAMAAVALFAVVAAALGIGVQSLPGEHLGVDEPQYWFTALSLAQDGDLDISNELAQRSWEQFTQIAPPVETVVQADGRQVSPHDPLLALLLAVPVAVGGWVAAKITLALLAGTLAAAMMWTAVRRFQVPLPLAATGVALAAGSAPLAVYGQQLYPELPAALACLLGVAAITGPTRRPPLALLGVAVVALPWLSVKYVPVAAVLAALAAWRWWRAGSRSDVLALGGALAVAAGLYLAVHRAVWGGWTVYASGGQFADTGEFAVVGVDPDFAARVWRLWGLLLDWDFGLAAWQPAWLLVVPAIAAVVAHSSRGFQTSALVLPLLTGWLVATFLASTMFGWWWPGRHTVVVLPLAVLVVLCWLARSGTAVRVVAAVAGLIGVSTYVALLVDGWAGKVVWVYGYIHVDAPVYQALRPLFPAFHEKTGQLIWVLVLLLIAAVACHHVTVTDTTTVTFRPPLTALIAVFGLIVCMTPVAFGVPGLQVLYVLPLSLAIWLVRTRTVVDPEMIVAHQVWGSRRIAWSDLAGLRVDDRSRVWAVVDGRDEVGLPAVRARHLPLLAAMSGGRLPDPSTLTEG